MRHDAFTAGTYENGEQDPICGFPHSCRWHCLSRVQACDVAKVCQDTMLLRDLAEQTRTPRGASVDNSSPFITPGRRRPRLAPSQSDPRTGFVPLRPTSGLTTPVGIRPQASDDRPHHWTTDLSPATPVRHRRVICVMHNSVQTSVSTVDRADDAESTTYQELIAQAGIGGPSRAALREATRHW